MADHPWFLPLAFGLLAVLQLITLIALGRLSRRVAALSRSSAPATPVPAAEAPLRREKETQSEQNRWFEVFLAEDPARAELPKKEQFAAFRRWREDKGLNWKAPGGG
jgi:hypothetical protein